MNMFRIVAMCLLVIAFALSCKDDDAGTPSGTVSVNLITDGLVSPVALIESPDNSGRLFVVDQSGQIYIIKNGTRISTPFLDIQEKLVARNGSQDERGLLGLTFHPQFPSNGKFYVFYSGPL